MSLSHRARTNVRRTTALALVAAGTASVGLFAGASPAAAVPGGNWEIDDHRHYAADTQEVGSDEFYLLKINFQVQLGVKDTFLVTKNSPYEIDDIDDGEYHGVADSMGQSRFSIGAWDPIQVLFNPFENQLDPGRFFNKGPWVFGSVTLMMESDTSPWSSINSVHRGVVASIQSNLKAELESLTPFVMFNEAFQQGIIARIDPNVAAFRDAVFESYLVGELGQIAVGAVSRAGMFNSLIALADDWIGAPRFTLAVGVEDNSFLGGLITSGAKNKGYWSAANARSATDHQIMPLPFTERRYKQQYSGDSARYIMDVRAGRI